jgi:L-seryl-tRNA(Ser) seleniumtransferase
MATRLVYDRSVSETGRKLGLYRRLPSVTRILREPALVRLAEETSKDLVVEAATKVLDELRDRIAREALTEEELDRLVPRVPDEVAGWIEAELSPSLRVVINATGVVVYTNAGRAPMAPQVLDGLHDAGGRYTNLEYDLDAGSRGRRDRHIEGRLRGLLKCEGATVCNNAAAALLLILNTLALGRKVLVSRGELIEIGGSFRLPDVMAKSGAVLREVGTTNKTRAADYLDAADPETALILRVHPSNFRIVGFTQHPTLEEMVDVSRRTGLPLVHDVGSGCLFPMEDSFLRDEPAVSNSLEAGVDLVCFSGDKLLGGPQAGLILGREDLVRRVRKNPLMRALRVDKLVYAALDRTLIEYLRGGFRRNLPVWRMLALSAEEIGARAESLRTSLEGGSLRVDVVEGYSLTGGGSAPEERIPTRLLAISSPRLSADRLEAALRRFRTPILCRIVEDRVLIDLRTVFPDQDAIVCEALAMLNAVDG